MTRRALVGVAATAVALVGVGVALGRWYSRTTSPERPGPAPTAVPGLATSGQPATIAPVDEVVRQSAAGRAPVIVVGLDAVDWDLLDPLIASRAMPNLAQLVREGDAGQLATLHPPLSPIVWTSMMTGADPVRHGVLDFVRLRPDTGDKEPITSSERKVPAIWNMASAAGKRVAVFGLWATYPAEPVNGLMVSDRMFTFLYSEAAPPEGVVYPRDSEAWAREVEARVSRQTDLAAVKAYLPWLTPAEYASATSDVDPYSHPVAGLRRILLETRIYHELATDWIRTRKPDLAIVYFQGTDSIGHVFAPFAPPRQTSISVEDYTRYSSVPRQYFHRIDEMLGDYRRLAEASGAALFIVSDHGFTWGEGRPTKLSSFANATAARWHRPNGIYLLWRPDTPRSSSARQQAGVTQVCATVMALLGMPRGAGLENSPVPPVTFASQASVDYARFFQPMAAPVQASRPAGSEGDQDRLAQLRALGYIGASEPSRVTPLGTGAERTRSAGSYNNEGLVLVNQGRIDEAIAAYEKALAIEPKLASALWNLSDLLFSRGRDLVRSDDLLLQALAAGLPDATRFVIGRAIGYQRSGDIARSLRLLGPATRIRPDEPEFWLFSGRYLVEQGECAKAVEQFGRAIAIAPDNPAAYSARALGRLCDGDRAGARTDLQRALALNPSDNKVRAMLKDLDRRP
ncbi:MAG: alkaline phosphatase family protein [Acidobacteria bacterium]|nr:alkaline phosphatase family protein [Acidobacteriota bacterium]